MTHLIRNRDTHVPDIIKSAEIKRLIRIAIEKRMIEASFPSYFIIYCKPRI